jgi:hypothetical protein
MSNGGSIPEIIVPGTPMPGPGSAPFVPFDIYNQSKAITRPSNPDSSVAFVAPALPQVIDEIIVQASRPKLPGRLTSLSKPSLFSFAGFYAVIGGLFIAKTIEELQRQAIDESFAEFMAPQRVPPAEIPVKTITDIFPNILVKAKRPTGLLAMPPMPMFQTDDLPDPFVMIPVLPRHVTTPAPAAPVVAPETEIPIPSPVFPLRIPIPLGIPLPLPLTAPQPVGVPLPLTAPGTVTAPMPQPHPLPLGLPQPHPVPFVNPFPQPQAQPQPLPLPQPRPLPTTFGSPLPRAMPLPLPLAQPTPTTAGTQECEPCAPEEPETRTNCFKKLVREGTTSDLDETYEWNEIDCFTGRDL